MLSITQELMSQKVYSSYWGSCGNVWIEENGLNLWGGETGRQTEEKQKS